MCVGMRFFNKSRMAGSFFKAAALLFFTFSATFALAQHDSTRYIFGLPVSEDDTAQVPTDDFEPKNRLTAVAPDQLPEKLREELESKEQYKGWEDSTVYFQNNTGLYLVPIKTDESVKLFGLTENGQPVTYNEIIMR